MSFSEGAPVGGAALPARVSFADERATSATEDDDPSSLSTFTPASQQADEEEVEQQQHHHVDSPSSLSKDDGGVGTKMGRRRSSGFNSERSVNRNFLMRQFQNANSISTDHHDCKEYQKSGSRISRQTQDALEESRKSLDELQGSLSIFGGQATEDTLEEDKDDEFELGDPLYDDKDPIGNLRNRCGALINSRIAQWFITFLIIANAIVLGVITFYFDNEDVLRSLEIADLCLLICFTIEISLQLFYLGRNIVTNAWLVFDIFVVVFSWSFLDSNIQILRSFRIFRVFALVSRWGALRRLFKAVGRTLPNMGTIAFALMVVLYVFCVLYTSLYNELYDQGYLDYDYFGRLDRTFLTLFQFMTLDSWTGVVRQVTDARPGAWVGFVFFVVVTAFFFLNLVVAVICESLIELNRMQDAKCQRKMLNQQRDLIADQTKQLLRETHDVVLLQKQMLANQLAMQQLMVEMALQEERREHETDSNSRRDGPSKGGGYKSALKNLLKAVEDSSQEFMPDDDGHVEPVVDDPLLGKKAKDS